MTLGAGRRWAQQQVRRGTQDEDYARGGGKTDVLGHVLDQYAGRGVHEEADDDNRGITIVDGCGRRLPEVNGWREAGERGERSLFC